MEKLIRKVLLTLDMIDVKGRNNLDRMLGCMQALEKIADAMAHNQKTFDTLHLDADADPTDQHA